MAGELCQENLLEYQLQSRKVFESANKGRLKYVEGIDLASPHLTRDPLLSRLATLAEENRYVYLRSPPKTGKTALTQLLYEYYVRDQACLVVSVSCLGMRDGIFDSGMNCELHALLKSKLKKVVLIIDDVQILFSGDAMLWELIKSGLCGNVSVFLFSCFGECSTRLEIPTSYYLGLNDLLLSKQEMRELLNLRSIVEDTHQISDVNSHEMGLEEFENSLYVATRGHVGLIMTVKTELQRLKFEFHQTNTSFTISQAMLFILSHELFGEMNNSRFIQTTEIEKFVDMEGTLNALGDTAKSIPFSPSDLLQSSLIKIGVLFVNSDYNLIYTCPWIRHIFLSNLRSLQNPIPFNSEYDIPSNVSEFVVDCIRRFRVSTFQSISKSSMIKREFQKEFYYVAVSLLQTAVKIDPDVRTTFGGNVDFDFYINSEMQWGIKFLVESDRLGAHVNRFGDCAMIPLKQFIFVDLFERKDSERKRLKIAESNIMHVEYSSDFHSWNWNYMGTKGSFEI